MRIGIITFHRAINYGAILQAYALQKYISHKGHQCKIIDYDADLYNKYRVFYDVHGFRSLCRALIYLPIIVIKKYKFKCFLRQMDLTKKIKYMDHYWDEIDNDFDLFIVGSDQVWNYEYIGQDGRYLLDFIKDSNKKHSYASSFGVEKICEYRDWYKQYLEDFSKIIVREKTGVSIIKEMFGEEFQADIALDPTFLISKDDWKNIETKPANITNKYILLYVFGNPTELIQYAEILAKMMNCPVIYISNDIVEKIDAIYARSIGPKEWLYLIDHAEVVITNSYHGLIFSLIFRKEFWVGLNPPPDNTNSRILDLLSLVNLKDRIINKYNKPKFVKNMDYEDIYDKLMVEMENSKRSLDEIFNTIK